MGVHGLLAPPSLRRSPNRRGGRPRGSPRLPSMKGILSAHLSVPDAQSFNDKTKDHDHPATAHPALTGSRPLYPHSPPHSNDSLGFRRSPRSLTIFLALRHRSQYFQTRPAICNTASPSTYILTYVDRFRHPTFRVYAPKPIHFRVCGMLMYMLGPVLVNIDEGITLCSASTLHLEI